VGAHAGLRFDESMVYLECSGEVTASVRYWDGVDGRPVAQGNIARQRVERSQKGQRVAALKRLYFVFVLVFVLFILLCFIVLILYSICYFKNGVPAGGIEASASGGGWSPCACCERDGRRLGQKLNAIRSEANPHARRTGLARADFGHDGMFMPLGEGCRESVWSGLVWSGLGLGGGSWSRHLLPRRGLAP
jgi:hypothetical protein